MKEVREGDQSIIDGHIDLVEYDDVVVFIGNRFFCQGKSVLSQFDVNGVWVRLLDKRFSAHLFDRQVRGESFGRFQFTVVDISFHELDDQDL